MGSKSRGAFGTGHRDDCTGCFICTRRKGMTKCLYCRKELLSGEYCSKRCFEAGVDDNGGEEPEREE